MVDATRRAVSRRQVLLGAALTGLGLGLAGGLRRPSRAAAAACDGTCGTLTAWMLEPDWGHPRGPNGKTRLISRASRRAAAHRLARSAADAEDMNLHLCSFAPPRPVQVCEHRFLAAWDRYARPWRNPWKGVTVRLLDTRWLPADLDLWSCPASETPVVPASTGTAGTAGLAGTGLDPRAAVVAGAGALAAGAILAGRARGAQSATAGAPSATDGAPATAEPPGHPASPAAP